MNAIFIVDVGEKFGIGHLNRCKQISLELKKNKIKTSFIYNYNDKKSKDFVKKIKNQILNFDFILIDSFSLKKEIDLAFRRERINLIYFNDFESIKYHQGILINPTISKIKSESNLDLLNLNGESYFPLDNIFKGFKCKIRPDINNVTITFGGSDVLNLTSKILEFLISNFDFKIDVIIGPYYQKKHIEKIRDLSIKNENILLWDSPKKQKIAKIFSKADVVISTGGQTLYELAYLGTPTIGIKTTSNCYEDLVNFNQLGFCEFIDHDKIDSVLYNLGLKLKSYDYNKRKKSNLNGRNLIDGKGSKRIVKEIIHFIKENENRN